jgi:hypothetical protein
MKAILGGRFNLRVQIRLLTIPSNIARAPIII